MNHTNRIRPERWKRATESEGTIRHCVEHEQEQWVVVRDGIGVGKSGTANVELLRGFRFFKEENPAEVEDFFACKAVSAL